MLWWWWCIIIFFFTFFRFFPLDLNSLKLMMLIVVCFFFYIRGYTNDLYVEVLKVWKQNNKWKNVRALFTRHNNNNNDHGDDNNHKTHTHTYHYYNIPLYANEPSLRWKNWNFFFNKAKDAEQNNCLQKKKLFTVEHYGYEKTLSFQRKFVLISIIV